MKTLKLSFYNPSDVGDRFLSPTIEELTIEPESGEISAKLSSGVVRELGSTLPKASRNAIDVRVVDGELVVDFDDGSQIVAGRALIDRIYSSPDIVGDGLLSSDGTYKPLVSVDSAITIAPTADGLLVNVDQPEGTSTAVDGALDFNLSSLFRDELPYVAPTSIASLANAFQQRSFPVPVINGAAISVNPDGTYVVPAGTYYIDCGVSTYLGGYSFAQLINVADDSILLESLTVNDSRDTSTPTGSATRAIPMSGYVVFTTTTTVAIRQFTERANSAGLYSIPGPLSAANGSYLTTGHIHFFRVSNRTVALPSTVEPSLPPPPIVQSLRDFTAQYVDRTPTVKMIFNETSSTTNFTLAFHHGDYIYYIGESTPSILRRNLITNQVDRFPLNGSGASPNYRAGALVGDKIYLIPYNADAVAIIDIPTMQVEYTKFGLNIPNGGTKWPSAVYVESKGKIYCAPYSRTDWLVIDVVNQTAILTNFGTTIPTGSKFLSAALAGNGKIYCSPYDITNIGILDTATETFTLSNLGATLTGSGKWWSAKYDPLSDKVFCIPHGATDILIIDCASNTATRNALGATLTGAAKWIEAVFVKDGILTALPGWSATDMLQIDTVAMSAVRKSIPWATTQLANGGVLVGDKYYVAPRVPSEHLVDYDIATETVEFIRHNRTYIVSSNSSTDRWLGIVKGKNSIAYPVPYGINDFYALDVINDRSVKVNWPQESTGGYRGGVMMKDGNIYFAPYGATNMTRLISPDNNGTPLKAVDMSTFIPSRIPSMTSNSQDGYVLTGSGVSGAAGDYHRAFFGLIDGSNASYGYSSNNRVFDYDNPHWVQIELPVAEKFDYFQYRLGYNYSPILTTLSGSNDGVNWTKLLDISDRTNVKYQWTRPRAIADNTAYKFYRIACAETRADNYACYGTIKFFNESDIPTKQYYEVNPSSIYTEYTDLSLTSDSTLSGYPLNQLSSDFFPREQANCWVTANTAFPHWVEIRKLEKFRANGLKLINAYNHYPRTFRIEATNNGKDYVTLAEFNEIGNTQMYYEHPIFEFENEEEYFAYRIFFTSGTSPNYLALGRLKLLTTDTHDVHNWAGRAENVPELNYGNGAGSLCYPIAHPDGKAYMPPINHTSWGVLDVDEMSLSLTAEHTMQLGTSNNSIGNSMEPYGNAMVSGRFNFRSTILKDGYVTDFRNNNAPFESLDVNTGTVSGCIDLDGRLWLAILNSNYYTIYDGRNGSFYTDYHESVMSGAGKHSGACIGPNGKLYMSPYTLTNYYEIDTRNRITNIVPAGTPSNTAAFEGCTLLKNGYIMFGSRRGNTGALATGFWVLDFGPGIEVPDEILQSPYIP